ncbi:pentapeptide repeat-containing protein [Streptomyces sp. NPDC001220]
MAAAGAALTGAALTGAALTGAALTGAALTGAALLLALAAASRRGADPASEPAVRETTAPTPVPPSHGPR